LNGDTILVLSDGREVLVNANDALLTTPEVLQKRILDYLRRRYSAIDYAFVGYGIASGFPNCHFIPGKNNAKSAEKRQGHFNRVWSSMIAGLNPKFGFPFAANVVLLDNSLIWANEPVHNSERPTERFRLEYPVSSTQVIDIAPGFTMIDGRIIDEILFEPVHLETLGTEMVAEIRKANEVRGTSSTQVLELAVLIESNIKLCQVHLNEFEYNYSVLIRLKNAEAAIVVTKSGNEFKVAVRQEPTETAGYDLVFSARFSYLRRALTTPWGYEVIMVGSGGTWRYASRQAAATNSYRELATILRKREAAPPSRFGDQPRWLYEAKARIKRGLGWQSDTLYDLLTWTVFDDEVTPAARAVNADRAIGRPFSPAGAVDLAAG